MHFKTGKQTELGKCQFEHDKLPVFKFWAPVPSLE